MSPADGQHGDLLVRGGTVVDGTGSPPRRADVRITGGVIAAVAPDLRPLGERILDATGAFVSPGFIDNHSHYDASLFWDPICDPMPQHGVTSVIIGNCSLSLVPLRAEHRAGIVSVFSFIEDIPLAAFEAGVPWAWESYDEYLAHMAARSFGVNVAQLVGHSPLRLFVMGEEAWDREATASERARMAAVLAECLDAGAFGLSTSFLDQDASGRPVPSRLADDAEYGELFDVLAARGGFVEFVPAYPDPTAAVDRIGALCGPRGVRATFNGIFYNEGVPESAVRFLDRCWALQQAGVQMYPQISPRQVDVRVNWDNTMMFMQLAQSWHKVVCARGDGKRELLVDPRWRETARAEWGSAANPSNAMGRPWTLRLTEVARPELEGWLDCSLADLVAERGGHPSDVLADWVLENDLYPGVVAVGRFNSAPDGVAVTLRHPAAVIGNSDAGAHLQMMCASGDATLLLARHVRERGDFTLERAIHEVTGRQAALFGFKGRGVLAPGGRGDVTVFDLDELQWGAEYFVSDLPDGSRRLTRPAGGYRYTAVSGTLTQECGILTGATPGRLLT